MAYVNLKTIDDEIALKLQELQAQRLTADVQNAIQMLQAARRNLADACPAGMVINLDTTTTK